jgi:hypothetical protein
LVVQEGKAFGQTLLDRQFSVAVVVAVLVLGLLVLLVLLDPAVQVAVATVRLIQSALRLQMARLLKEAGAVEHKMIRLAH